MRAIVVYESIYGNTRTVAEALGDGLSVVFDTSVVPVDRATADLIADADLVAVGGPTHVHSMSRATTRKAAIDAAHERALTLDTSADGSGLRDWFAAVGTHPHAIAVAFDTRLDMPAAITGRAGRGIARHLRRCHFSDVRDAGSFMWTRTTSCSQEKPRGPPNGDAHSYGTFTRSSLANARPSVSTPSVS